MEILFLGTGASEWSIKDRQINGYRRKSSILIDGELMIDVGPDIFVFEEDFSYKDLFSNVDNILQTHSHLDHLSKDSLETLCNSRIRNIYGDGAVLNSIGDMKNLIKNPLCPYTPTKVGEYTVTSLLSNHPANYGEQPVHYIVEKEGRRIFYGCDGAWLLFGTWSYIRKLKFDLIILDGTTGELNGNLRNFEHNNLAMARLLATTFRENKLLNPDGRIMISHMAMSLHGTHEDLEKRLAKDVVISAYDNMRVMA
jgi:phosphoribosyl 1,2-cyclic phosphate phosphodiesterase